MSLSPCPAQGPAVPSSPSKFKSDGQLCFASIRHLQFHIALLVYNGSYSLHYERRTNILWGKRAISCMVSKDHLLVESMAL